MSAALDTLGAEIRAARGAESLRSVAGRVGIAPSYLSDIEHGRRAPSADTLRLIAHVLSAWAQLPRWEALCGRIPDDIERAILGAPERWNDLRAWLARKAGLAVDAQTRGSR